MLFGDVIWFWKWSYYYEMHDYMVITYVLIARIIDIIGR